jgi:hypothetical protein
MDNPRVSKVKIELQIDFTDPVEGAEQVMEGTCEALRKLLQERGLILDEIEIGTMDFRESGKHTSIWQLNTKPSEN